MESSADTLLYATGVPTGGGSILNRVCAARLANHETDTPQDVSAHQLRMLALASWF
jgi:hypothetical protein